MMDNPAFLNAIIENPEDDTARLAYADWLDENGDSTRSEFIRVQCALSRKAKYDPSRELLEKRVRELLARHEDEWAKPVAAITREYEFHRGFIDTVVIGGRKLLTHGVKLFEVAPVRNVRVVRLGSSNVSAEELVNCPVLSRIRGLTLQGVLGENELYTLLTSRGLKNLIALTLEDYFRAEAIEPLLSGCLPRLEKLDLCVDASILTTSDAETLAKARWASKLKHLNLKNHAINVGGVQAIASSKNLKQLTYLNLNDCGVGLTGTKAIAESSSLAKLETLDLRRNRLTDKAVRTLVASSRLPALNELFLGMNDIGPEGAEALANWPGLTQLRLLHLYSTQIGDDGVCALAESPHIANLRYLDVTHTDMGERGTRALEESPYLRNVNVGSFKGD
jgi:uncharacterized protein (TIGR02996 family)